MSVTILEALQNADYNLTHASLPTQTMIAKSQLHNAIELLVKGYELDDEVEPLLEKYGKVENVPDKD